uniref:CBS domain-containing protein n=1 Tax=Kalanchoe fedtschenkoi TaxID=63787 RepID=A0A7N0U6H6_KALFE
MMGEADVTVPRMAVNEELIVSRRRLSDYLSTHKAYDLLPQSGKVLALDVNLPVKQAFHILYEQGISVAPLWDFDAGSFVGIITAMDFILILKELQNWGSSMSQEEHETRTIAYWKKMKSQPSGMLDCIEKQSTKPLIYVSAHFGNFEFLKVELWL